MLKEDCILYYTVLHTVQNTVYYTTVKKTSLSSDAAYVPEGETDKTQINVMKKKKKAELDRTWDN